ncbi:hypothetical protein GPECTOR_25g402 [Gonium pectorale]|uniref:Uncharacterized protein n=1 Tax=Gonium pectorale TaxID=33097 RepID=A0A150GG46_GONPE|nr:hypothetical protein GPECTOR_25g402 [Gonium pectorale]|eukprot:KXZ48817.1 hypothetical protein GPECTOR_25g402 [Gonium pectorale]
MTSEMPSPPADTGDLGLERLLPLEDQNDANGGCGGDGDGGDGGAAAAFRQHGADAAATFWMEWSADAEGDPPLPHATAAAVATDLSPPSGAGSGVGAGAAASSVLSVLDLKLGRLRPDRLAPVGGRASVSGGGREGTTPLSRMAPRTGLAGPTAASLPLPSTPAKGTAAAQGQRGTLAAWARGSGGHRLAPGRHLPFRTTKWEDGISEVWREIFDD